MVAGAISADLPQYCTATATATATTTCSASIAFSATSSFFSTLSSEWSQTCKRLGVTKSIDKFTQAIGLVINMELDPAEPRTKDPRLCSPNLPKLTN